MPTTLTSNDAEIRERQAQAADALRDLLRRALPLVKWEIWTYSPDVKAPLTGQISMFTADPPLQKDYPAQLEALHTWAGFLRAEVEPYHTKSLQVSGTWQGVPVHIWTTTEASEEPS